MTVVHLLVSKVKLDHCKNLILNPILISESETLTARMRWGSLARGAGCQGSRGEVDSGRGNERGVTLQWVLTLNRVGGVVCV